VAKKRGFFAELQHQNQVAHKRQVQAANARARANTAAARQAEQAMRQAEQAMRQAERAQTQAVRASAVEQKAAQKEAERLLDEAMASEASAKNAELATTYEEIDGMLATALTVDCFIDLDALRVAVHHPPFTRGDLEVPTPHPQPLVARPEPRYLDPEAPRGLGGVLGKKKHAEAVAHAWAAFVQDHARWDSEVAALPAAQFQQMQAYEAAEAQRLGWVAQVRQEYQRECAEREAEAAGANASLDDLIRGVSAGAPAAVTEYVGIVLGNSVYPDVFPVEHDPNYEGASRELILTVTVPPPEVLPSEKAFKYVKAKREVAATSLTKKEQKDRYTNAVCQVAVRRLHETFAADRNGHIQTVALSVGTENIDAATGLPKHTPLVAVAADRDHFMTFHLAEVVPLATLKHLGAVVSASPFDLTPIDTSRGVRGNSR